MKKEKVLVAQSCLTLCDTTDCSPPGFSLHGILQPRILEWVVFSFSSGSSRPRNQTGISFIAGGFFTNWGMREAMHKGSLLSTSSPIFVDRHPNRCEAVLHYGFNLSFLMISDAEQKPVRVPIDHLYIFLGKISSWELCPFLNQVIWFFAIEL